MPSLVQERGLYPNPFVSQLNVYFRLRVDAEVTVAIYNVAGEPVRRLQVPGQAGDNLLPWLGVNDAGSRCASGVYVVHVLAQGRDGTQGGFWDRAVVQR